MQIEGGRGAILFREECPSHFVYLGGWLGGMFLFSGRKTVGAYRIRPEVRAVVAVLLGACSGWFVWFAHVEGVCDTPLHLFD